MNKDIKSNNVCLFYNKTNEILQDVKKNDIFVYNLVTNITNVNTDKNYDYLLTLSNQLINYSWERMHYPNISWELILQSIYPTIYSLSILLYNTYRLELCMNEKEINIDLLNEFIQLCDYGILMGPSNDYIIINSLNNLIDYINQCLYNNYDNERSSKIQKRFHIITNKSNHTLSHLLNNNITILSTITSPSLLEFYNNYLLKSQPVVINDVMSDWPCLSIPERSWSEINYIKKICGNRTVPIELGRNYLSNDSKQTLMTINQFIDDYCLNNNNNAYLAQHRLLDQITILKNDICIPDYCSLYLPNETENDDVITNAWFGPSNTVSPLHHDSYHNLLAQVVGYKYIRLYEECHSIRLFPLHGIQSNNSEVDLTNIEEIKSKYIDVLDIPCYEIVLCPGQMIYIPRWCWHFVQSITLDQAIEWFNKHNVTVPNHMINYDYSFSVNFWWGDRLIKS